MPKKRAHTPSNSVTLERFTEDELALELVKRQKTQWQKGKAALQAPSWCLDASTKEVMQDPVTLKCGHSIDRKELERVFKDSHFHTKRAKVKKAPASFLYKCPVKTCKKAIVLRPEDTPDATSLKQAIVAETERKHKECDQELQKGYDTIKDRINAGVLVVTKELGISIKITRPDKDGKTFFGI
jgi:hypothetical protein